MGQEELIQLLVTFDLMRDVDWFVGGSLESHFTALVYAWVCSLRHGHCPSLGLMFGGGLRPTGPQCLNRHTSCQG